MVLPDIFRNRRRYRDGEAFMRTDSFTAVQSATSELPNAI